MKILHTSDIHIDSPLTARLPSNKIRQRRRELLSGFGELVAEAKREGASAVIIAGDLFDSENVTKRARDTVLDTIERAPSVTFFYLRGNHEGNALLDSDAALPKNLLLFGNEWTYYQAGSLTIAGRSSCSSDMFEKLELPTDTKNIVILHGELRDRSASPDVIGKADAAGKNIDYIALGHYHSYSATPLDSRCTAVYSGTPEGRGFDEIGDCGYVMINIDDKIYHIFVTVAKRRLREIPLSL